ncbi:MAG: hypothetical protein KDI64_17415, partial [Candidatus Accumulibacter sp.]|nr:hypothetical protein [Accumulibacter sp.]
MAVIGSSVQPHFQAVIAAPGFCLGVCCDEDEVQRIVFLPAGPALAARNALAAETARQLAAYLADAAFSFG